MSIDKFGSHILDKDNNFNKFSTNLNESKILKIVDLSGLKLYYNLVLPFLGKYNEYNHTENAYQLLQDRRINYVFPINSATIIAAEYPKKYVTFKVNGKTIIEPEGFELKKGDIISFHRPDVGTLEEFYGELLIKCEVELEK